MPYSKYPEEIQYYHDLFEGDFFLPENQQLFSAISEKLKKKIYTILAKESSIVAHASILTNGPIGDMKHRTWIDYISQGNGRQNPIDYISKLESSDRDNIYKLLFEVFYNKDEGLYRNGVNRVFVIGSSTYGKEYRHELSQGPRKDDTGIQQRVQKEGNDIDLLIGANSFVSAHLINDYGIIANKQRQSNVAILNFACALLSKNNIPYTIEDHKKNGTTHLWLKNTEIGEIMTHTGKIIDYHHPNIIVKLPSGRPIHISVDKENIDGAYKREFLEGRNYVCLFDGPRQQYICRDAFNKIAAGETITIPATLEERYNTLQHNKRNRYIQNLQYQQKKREEATSDAKLTQQERADKYLGFF